MDHKKSTGGKKANIIKRSPAIQALHQKVISLSRQPAVLADQPRELAVPAKEGQLRNQ
jgi:hypothetical protein